MASGILLVPLYLKFLPLNVYGTWLAAGNILAWLTVIDPGVSTILKQRVAIAYGRRDFAEIRDYLLAGLVISSIIAIGMIVTGLIFAKYIPTLLNLPVSVDPGLIKKAFIMAITGSSLIVFSNSITCINQGLQSSVGTGIIYLTVMVLSILITIYLLFQGFGLIAAAFAPICQGAGLAVGNFGYLIWRMRSENLGRSFSFKRMAPLVKLISFTFLGRMGTVLANNMDLMIVARSLGPEVVAVLNLTRKGPEISRNLIERPAVAFTPAISHLLGSGQAAKVRIVLLRLICILLWVLGLICGGFITFNDDFVRLWVGSEFFGGTTINVIICSTLALSVASNSLSTLCLALGDIRTNSLVCATQSVIMMIILFPGVKLLGILGAVLAPLLSFAVVSIWYFPLSFSRLLRLGHRDSKRVLQEACLTLFVTCASSFLFWWVFPPSWLNFVVHIALFCCTFGAALLAVSPPFRREVEGIIRRLRSSLLSRHLQS